MYSNFDFYDWLAVGFCIIAILFVITPVSWWRRKKPEQHEKRM